MPSAVNCPAATYGSASGSAANIIETWPVASPLNAAMPPLYETCTMLYAGRAAKQLAGQMADAAVSRGTVVDLARPHLQPLPEPPRRGRRHAGAHEQHERHRGERRDQHEIADGLVLDVVGDSAG